MIVSKSLALRTAWLALASVGSLFAIDWTLAAGPETASFTSLATLGRYFAAAVVLAIVAYAVHRVAFRADREIACRRTVFDVLLAAFVIGPVLYVVITGVALLYNCRVDYC